jgi:ketosteroid isomerase-like protein
MRVVATTLWIGLAACGGGGGGGAAKPKAVVGPAVDEKQAEKDARGLVTEIYEMIGRGKKDNLFSLLDDSLVVFGPRMSDALGNRTDALVALGEIVDPKSKTSVKSGDLEVVASTGGRSAWAFDIVSVGGASHAVFAILINSDDLWQVDAAVVAQMPSKSSVKAGLEKDAIVPPGAAAKSSIEPDARPVVERFQKGLLDQQQWGDDLVKRSDAIVVGPQAGEITRGKKEIKKLWRKRVDNKTRAATSGDIVAAVTPDGQLAWVSAPITRIAEEEAPLPLRAFAVYEKSDTGWQMIALHESLAVGEAGAGTPFKKAAPPKEPEKPVVAEKAEEPKKKKADEPKKKKKKKKKKKPKVEEE